MTRPWSGVAAPVAAALVVATGLVGLAAAPASAAFCSGSGVNVVVDFNGLGGGVQRGCDPAGANRSADRVFPAAGFGLTYAQRQPGFVCRVQGKPGPAQEPCQNAAPADAYWGLYWSDGKSGKWSYSSSGVGGLKVPQGGFVAFSWQNGGSADPPGAAPTNNQPAPKPDPAPSKQPTKAPAKSPTKSPTKDTTKAPGPEKSPSKTPGSAPGATSEPGTKAPTPSARSSSTTSASAGPSAPSAPTVTADPTSSALPGDSITLEPSDDAEDGTANQAEGQLVASELGRESEALPTWVPVLALLGLAAAAASAVVWRRRRGL